MVVISNYLINNPYKLTSLNTFAEKYESAKSSISEDIVIIKRAFEEIEIGHIALIDSEITKTVMELGIDDTREEVVLLRHVILSHHGLLEYGSPVRPRIMEAEIIHMIDNLDASMMMMSTALALVDKGEMTNKIFAMDNRSFYKPDLD